MKKIIVLFVLLLGSIISIAQPVTQRGTTSVTVQDARLFAEFNFRPPAFPDTIRANQQIGLDSCGALIFSRDINAYYYRACSPKRWVRVASGGNTSDSAYLSYRPLTDSTFLLCRVGGTRCDTIKVNGKGVTEAWLLGGNLNPKFNTLGTTSTQDVVIITNDVARMKIAGNGINRSSAARNRYLMIDTSSRYLYYGDEADTTAWKLLGNSNAIAGTSFLGTTNNVPLEFRIKNKKSGIIDSTNKNVGLGFNTLKTNAPNGVILPPPNNATLGTYNVAIGHNALSKDTLGYQNVAIGGGALGTTTTYSQRNVAIGYAALNQSITPSLDVAIGWGALARDYYGQANTAVGADVANFYAPTSGDTMAFNTLVGYSSAKQKKAGKYNVFVGDSTGALNINGSSNVFIGSRAGQNETGSSKLYISNSSTSNPLIKGDFADSTLNVNGKMSISLTSQTPDSSLDVTGGVKLRTIYRSSALTDSMLVIGADGGVSKREIIVPSNTNVTRIISGSAVWDSLMIYSVTKCWYYINGILYTSAPTNVTLAAADSSNPRIDVIYCDTLGNVGVITGIPSPDPVKPTVNPLSQIELTHIYINAQGTIPANVGSRIIYDENLGIPNEWNTSTNIPASGVNFAYTTNPYSKLKSIIVPPYNGDYSLIFTNNAFVNADTLSELSMYLIQNSASPARVGGIIFNVVLFKSGVQVTRQMPVINGVYGYDISVVGSYQHIAIPFSDFVFQFPFDKTFDQIQIQIVSAVIPKLGFQFDYITTTAGGTPPPITSNYWSLDGNDNSTFPNAKLGTTSKDQLSIVTSDIERINIANNGIITIPKLQTTTDTLLYKPMVINPNDGQVAMIESWGNNIVYTQNPIMSRTSGDSNIIYFNADTANVWRGGGGAVPTLQQVLTAGRTESNPQDFSITLNEVAGDGANVFNAYNNNKEFQRAILNINNYYNEPYFQFGTFDYSGDGNAVDIRPSGILFLKGNTHQLLPPATTTNQINTLPNTTGYLATSVNGQPADINGNITISAGGTGTVTDISQGYGITASPTNPITTSGTITVDTTTSGLSGKYLRINDTIDMLTPYLRKVDTTNKFVNNISRTLGKDSIIFNIGSNRYAIKDSVGSQNLQQVTDKGATTSNSILISDNLSQAIQYKNNSIEFRNFEAEPYKYQTLYPSPYYKYQSDTLPTRSGILAISVNGVKADTSGNITLTTGGGGTVTSITQGYGITNSPNPIVATGTVTVDTTTGGLSGKYVRINDTATMLLPYLFGSGTANYVPKFSTTRKLAISQIYDNGTSVGIGTASPNASYKLDVNGIISTNNGINISPSTSTKTGIYGSSNTMEFWAGNNKIASYTLATIGGALYDFPYTLNFGSSASGSVSGMHLATSVTPNGNNSVDFNQLLINPSYNQTPVSGTGTGVLRGIYYNPTLTSLGTSKHIAFQSTSGDIILNNLKTSSSTSDSIAIFVNDTLKKAPYPTATSMAQGYYGAWQDNVTQTAAASNTGYAMIFRTTDLSNGVSVVSNGTNLTRITFANTGIYNLQFSSQFQNTDNAQHDVTVWLRLNGSDVAGSAGFISVPARKSAGAGNEGHLITGWNYVLSVVAGQYYELMWSTSNAATVTMQYYAAGSPPPSAASVIMTVTQQSGIMAGTGITGLGTSGNIQTGATQTLATGTSGSDFNISSSSNTQTFNLPNASSSNRGALLAADWTTFNNKIGAADTSVFQRKSISSYTMLANNTNATGNATAQTFRDTAGTYAGTITWSGTAPTAQTINTYQWQQTGKWVHLQLFGYYTNAGSACTAVTFTLPSDCPAPDISMFTSGALAVLYQGLGGLGTSNVSTSLTTTAYMRRNAANGGNELYLAAASSNYRRYQFDITYRAQ